MSTALLAIAYTGFLMMTAASAGRTSREQRLEQSGCNLSVWTGQEEGDPTGETITVEFSLEGTSQIREIFEQYEVTESGEDASNHTTFYRYK